MYRTLSPCFALAALASVATSACIDTPGTNLITNGGFQLHRDSIAPWFPDVGGDFLIRRPGFKSSQALAFNGSDGYYYYSFMSTGQSIDSCPNTWYTISWDHRLPGQNAEILVTAGPSIGFVSNTPKKATVWTHHAYNVYLTGSTAVSYGFSRNSTQLPLIDNVIVTALGDISPVAGAKELAVNGDVETGDFAPWMQNAPKQCKVTSPGYRSQYAISCRTTVYSGGYGALDDISLSQTFNTTRNTQYLLTGIYKISQYNPEFTVSRCSIQFYYQNNIMFDVDALGMAPTNNTWMDIYLPFIAPTASSSWSVRISTVQNFNRRPDCVLVVDNLSVKEASL